MPKRATNVLKLLSAVVCVGSLMLVGRSFWRAEFISFPIDKQSMGGAITYDAQLVLLHVRGNESVFYGSTPTAVVRGGFQLDFRPLWDIRWLGIGWGSNDEQKYLLLPLWLLPLLTAIAPVRWWLKRRRGGGRGLRWRRRGRGYVSAETVEPGAGCGRVGWGAVEAAMLTVYNYAPP